MAYSRDYDVKQNGYIVRAYRLRKKQWMQSQLAEAAGVTEGTISRIETGVHCPHLATVSRLARALEVEVDQLVDWRV